MHRIQFLLPFLPAALALLGNCSLDSMVPKDSAEEDLQCDASLQFFCESNPEASQRISCSAGCLDPEGTSTCTCIENDTVVGTCQADRQNPCGATNCCGFQPDHSAYYESCTQGGGPCGLGYECTTTIPQRSDEFAAEVCLLPCDAETDCGSAATCVCKGIPGGGQSDGPVPDGYCECG